MNINLSSVLATLALAFVIPGSNVQADHQDDLLREVHGVLRVTGANVQWVANQAGGLTPQVVYDVTNQTDRTVLIPVTVIGGTAANWAGSRQHWIERIGPDPNIPAIPRNVARRGRQYAFGGSAIPWPGQAIVPRGFVRYAELIQTGGFPSGRYALTIEYLTTHDLRLIQSQVVYIDVP
jgi:hypothetical protein